MKNKYERLEADTTFHIYNRANGKDLLFAQHDDYVDFLRRMYVYLSPITRLHCQTLLPNHFHLMLRFRNKHEIEAYYLQKMGGNLKAKLYEGCAAVEQEQILQKFMNQQFSNMFNGYAQKRNMQTGRKGNLFMRPFKRKKVISEAYRNKLVHYILRNPVIAGLSRTPGGYRYSSYHTIANGQDEDALEVLSWFDGEENFRAVMSCSTFPVMTDDLI
jgi:hypothetical protein